jgi:YD repeat-containing protein
MAAVLKTYSVVVTDTLLTIFFDARQASGGKDQPLIAAIEVFYDAPPPAPNMVARLNTGTTSSSDFTTTNAYDSSFNGGDDAFVAKLNAAGTQLRYSTFLGGSAGKWVADLAVDGSGAAYVLGTTSASNVATTADAYDRTYNGADDLFIAKLSASGRDLLYGSYLGGSQADAGAALALDGAGGIIVVGDTASADYPTTYGALDTRPAVDPNVLYLTDLFVTHLQPGNSTLRYSTYLGSPGIDWATGVAYTTVGGIVVVGNTVSGNFPVTNGAYSPGKGTGYDDGAPKVIVARFAPDVTLAPSTRVVTYAYDGLLRLITATESPGASFSYSYDTAGNRLTVREHGARLSSVSYDAANQVVTAEQAVGWRYDAAGNLLSDGVRTYAYDALNRPITVTLGTHERVNGYTGDGLLLTQRSNGLPTTSTHDLAAALPQVLRSAGSTTAAQYVYGHERLTLGTGPSRQWVIGDALGSVRLVLDGAGVAQARQFYEPWGTPQYATAPQPFGFTGELHDPTLGLVNLRARWYDASADDETLEQARNNLMTLLRLWRKNFACYLQTCWARSRTSSSF